MPASTPPCQLPCRATPGVTPGPPNTRMPVHPPLPSDHQEGTTPVELTSKKGKGSPPQGSFYLIMAGAGIARSCLSYLRFRHFPLRTGGPAFLSPLLSITTFRGHTSLCPAAFPEPEAGIPEDVPTPSGHDVTHYLAQPQAPLVAAQDAVSLRW